VYEIRSGRGVWIERLMASCKFGSLNGLLLLCAAPVAPGGRGARLKEHCSSLVSSYSQEA
jgi:hypothetical protein